MKRSEINKIMLSADQFIKERGFFLPPFAYWLPEDWRTKGEEVGGIVANHLGWDITDFGMGDFSKYGLFLFTLRNGNPDNWKTLQGKLYAEKVMLVEQDQITPYHFHWNKMEDIINRGGGNLMIQLYNATAQEDFDRVSPVILSVDGTQRVLPAEGILCLEPGESVSLPQFCYHQFWGQAGRVLVGEVSMVNDDHTDNRFNPPVGRFPTIEEDEDPLYLLCNDYERYYRAS